MPTFCRASQVAYYSFLLYMHYKREEVGVLLHDFCSRTHVMGSAE